MNLQLQRMLGQQSVAGEEKRETGLEERRRLDSNAESWNLRTGLQSSKGFISTRSSLVKTMRKSRGPKSCGRTGLSSTPEVRLPAEIFGKPIWAATHLDFLSFLLLLGKLTRDEIRRRMAEHKEKWVICLGRYVWRANSHASTYRYELPESEWRAIELRRIPVVRILLLR